MEAVNGYVRVTCESNNPLVSPQLCTLESIEEKEEEFNCMFLLYVFPMLKNNILSFLYI